MKKMKVVQMVVVALFAALLSVLSQIAFPLPSGVPVTLQTFAVALCGFTLGSKLGTLSVAVYLLLGAIGLPVFSGFVAGIGIFAGVSGGFLWGFLALAALCGMGKVIPAAIGLLICHALGVLQFSLIAQSPIWQAFSVASLPFLLKDLASVAIAMVAARAVRRGLAAARVSI